MSASQYDRHRSRAGLPLEPQSPSARDRERRPPRQLYIPPAHRLVAGSSGFNRPSSPGLSTCSEIVTSWRTREQAPARSGSPGALSRLAGLPPAGPRRRPSGAEADLNWRQSCDSLGSSRPSSRQSQCAPASPSKRSGRRRRRGGRSRSHELLDQPSPVTPPSAPWRREPRGSWDGGQPCRSPSPAHPTAPPRPLFQLPYQPPGARSRQPREHSAAPPPAANVATSRYHDNRMSSSPSHSLDRRQRRGQNEQHHRQSTPQRQNPHQKQETWSRHQSPRRQNQPQRNGPPDQAMSQSMHESRQQEFGDDAFKSASLPRSRRRRSRRRRRDKSGGAVLSPAGTPRSGSVARSPSPTAILSQLRGSASPPVEPSSGLPQSPTDIIANLRARDTTAAPAAAAMGVEPASPTDLLQQLMLSSAARDPRRLVNTTDDEKASLRQQRGRGRGRGHKAASSTGHPQPSHLRRPGEPHRRPDGSTVEPGSRENCTMLPMSYAKNMLPYDDRASKNEAEMSCPQRGLQLSIPSTDHDASLESDDIKLKSDSVLLGAASRDSRKLDSADNQALRVDAVGLKDATRLTSNVGDGRLEMASNENQNYAQMSKSVDEAAPDSLREAALPSLTVSEGSPAAVNGDSPNDSCSAAGAQSVSAAAAATPANPVPATTEAVESPEREEEEDSTSRRHSSTSSGRDFFNTSLDEPFNWADEVDAWEERYGALDSVADGAESAQQQSLPATGKTSDDASGDTYAAARSQRHHQLRCGAAPLPAHVLELYDLPRGFSQRDLLTVLQPFAERGLRLHRVDDAHAVAVFENASTAAEALRLRHPLVRSRPLAEASSGARQYASVASHVTPAPRPRPPTSALHASRLVTSALGVRASPQQSPSRQREQRKLSQAREQKQQAARQRRDAWDGRF